MKSGFVFLLFVAFSAQAFNRDIQKEKIIEDQLKEIDSSLLNNFKSATIAMDENNLVLADSLYSIVYESAPQFDPLLRRLGSIKTQLGKTEEGIKLCEKAVAINKSAYNIISLAGCYLYAGKESKGYEQNLQKGLSLMKEAENMPHGDELEFPSLIGQIALELNDVQEFRNTTDKLINKYPDTLVTHYYAAILATIDEKWSEAKKEILIAGEMGLPEETVQGFLDSGVQNKVTFRLFIKILIIITSIWILGILILFGLGKLLSNLTLNSLEKKEGVKEISSSERYIRSVYKFLINIGGIYYYISLPIILVLVVALVAGLFYLFLLVGRIPIQLMLALIVGSGFTIYGMVRSLLVKINYADSGRALNKEEAPELFRLTVEVANMVGTRPIDEIRITPSTDLAVYERGSWKEKLNDKAQRILILGVGVLENFKKSDFSAVLAHEYGHFSNRDTAGGNIAMRVRNDINKYFYALYYAGQNVWWNIAFQFLRLYNLIFVRISHGATRLQEVLADRVAAQIYGKSAFRNGLTYVIKRDIEFNKYASAEIDEAKKIERPFNNLYELSGDKNEEVESELMKELDRKTSEYDTHPSPTDRFRYIDLLPESSVSSNHQDNTVIKDFFMDWNAITKEMTSVIENGNK